MTCKECERFQESHMQYEDFRRCMKEGSKAQVFRYMNYKDDPENRVCQWCPKKVKHD